VLSAYWEPYPVALEDQLAGPAGTARGMRQVWRALRLHDRGRNERRVLKIGVWGMETDEEAEAAFRELLERAIRS
jgi:hypothetical protein